MAMVDAQVVMDHFSAAARHGDQSDLFRSIQKRIRNGASLDNAIEAEKTTNPERLQRIFGSENPSTQEIYDEIRYASDALRLVEHSEKRVAKGNHSAKNIRNAFVHSDKTNKSYTQYDNLKAYLKNNSMQSSELKIPDARDLEKAARYTDIEARHHLQIIYNNDTSNGTQSPARQLGFEESDRMHNIIWDGSSAAHVNNVGRNFQDSVGDAIREEQKSFEKHAKIRGYDITRNVTPPEPYSSRFPSQNERITRLDTDIDRIKAEIDALNNLPVDASEKEIAESFKKLEELDRLGETLQTERTRIASAATEHLRTDVPRAPDVNGSFGIPRTPLHYGGFDPSLDPMGEFAENPRAMIASESEAKLTYSGEQQVEQQQHKNHHIPPDAVDRILAIKRDDVSKLSTQEKLVLWQDLRASLDPPTGNINFSSLDSRQAIALQHLALNESLNPEFERFINEKVSAAIQDIDFSNRSGVDNLNELSSAELEKLFSEQVQKVATRLGIADLGFEFSNELRGDTAAVYQRSFTQINGVDVPGIVVYENTIREKNITSEEGLRIIVHELVHDVTANYKDRPKLTGDLEALSDNVRNQLEIIRLNGEMYIPAEGENSHRYGIHTRQPYEAVAYVSEKFVSEELQRIRQASVPAERMIYAEFAGQNSESRSTLFEALPHTNTSVHTSSRMIRAGGGIGTGTSAGMSSFAIVSRLAGPFHSDLEAGGTRARWAMTAMGADASALVVDGVDLSIRGASALRGLGNSGDDAARAVSGTARATGIAGKFLGKAPVAGMLLSVGAGYADYRTALAAGDMERAYGAVGGTTGGVVGGFVAGGAVGLAGGPAAPITVPLGAIAGGFTGAYYGDEIARELAREKYSLEFNEEKQAAIDSQIKGAEEFVAKQDIESFEGRTNDVMLRFAEAANNYQQVVVKHGILENDDDKQKLAEAESQYREAIAELNTLPSAYQGENGVSREDLAKQQEALRESIAREYGRIVPDTNTVYEHTKRSLDNGGVVSPSRMGANLANSLMTSGDREAERDAAEQVRLDNLQQLTDAYNKVTALIIISDENVSMSKRQEYFAQTIGITTERLEVLKEQRENGELFNTQREAISIVDQGLERERNNPTNRQVEPFWPFPEAEQRNIDRDRLETRLDNDQIVRNHLAFNAQYLGNNTGQITLDISHSSESRKEQFREYAGLPKGASEYEISKAASERFAIETAVDNPENTLVLDMGADLGKAQEIAINYQQDVAIREAIKTEKLVDSYLTRGGTVEQQELQTPQQQEPNKSFTDEPTPEEQVRVDRENAQKQTSEQAPTQGNHVEITTEEQARVDRESAQQQVQETPAQGNHVGIAPATQEQMPPEPSTQPESNTTQPPTTNQSANNNPVNENNLLYTAYKQAQDAGATLNRSGIVAGDDSNKPAKAEEALTEVTKSLLDKNIELNDNRRDEPDLVAAVPQQEEQAQVGRV